MYCYIVKRIDLSSTRISDIKEPKLLLPKVIICKAALDLLLKTIVIVICSYSILLSVWTMVIKYNVNEMLSCLLAEQFLGLIYRAALHACSIYALPLVVIGR